MTFPMITLPSLPPNTIVPENDALFIPYLNRLYEEIAFAVNNKDNLAFPIAITDVAQDIPNVPNYGAFIICVYGEVYDSVTPSALPTLNASLCKSDPTAAGSIAVLGSQAGTGGWGGINLTVTSTATNFQIKHNLAATSGNFLIRILGT